MTKDGKLSKREMDTLNKAWGILSKWSEINDGKMDSDDFEESYLYDSAMNAVAGLCEFISNYEE